jgi:cyclophilin family peptidyl-prolyl cis-trans isomerase
MFKNAILLTYLTLAKDLPPPMQSFFLSSLLLATSTFAMDTTSDQLLERCTNVQESIKNQRGLAPGDIASIQALRDEINTWNSTNEDAALIVAELQLNLLLNELDTCNSLFKRLAELNPENTHIGLAWANFRLKQDGADAEIVYGDLAKRYPDSPEIAIAWIRFLDGANRYTEGILEIEKRKASEPLTIELSQLYADLLYANNRFEDAVETLDTIDPSLLSANPALSTRINSKKAQNQTAADLYEIELVIQESEAINRDLPIAQVFTSKGPITLELYEDHAPNTVANFISLAESGYYDGTRFHRVLPKFMAQGGDPNSRDNADGQAGTGGPGYTIKDEHTGDDIRKHFAGSLSMAKTGAPNTGGSQFFLTHLPTPHLDGRHTVFGRIISGLDIARSIEVNDDIVTIIITNKRDHAYVPEKIGEKNSVTISPIDDGKTMQKQKPSLNSGE